MDNLEWKIFVRGYGNGGYYGIDVTPTGKYKFVSVNGGEELMYIEVIQSFLGFFTKKRWYCEDAIHISFTKTEYFECGVK